MSCETCGDKGIVRVNWADIEADFAVCLCSLGVRLRSETNAHRRTVPLWQLWAAREQVEFGRMVMLEDVLSPDELSEHGFTGKVRNLDERDIIAAGRTRKGKL